MLQNFAMMLWKSNTDIQDFLKRKMSISDQKTRRQAVRIAVIDDQPFAPQTNLQSYGYQITPIGDVKDLKEVAPFNIILCDLMGVGLHFDRENQGASLIAEIKRNYPEKIVIAYTGASMSSPVARSAGGRADEILKKDIHIEDWTETLDTYVNEAIDPYIIWQKIRVRLVELDADTKTIMSLENAFVRSVLARDINFSKIRALLPAVSANSDVRAIIQSLIASLVFKVIFGS